MARAAIARVVTSALEHGPVHVIVNNKAEGCSPASVVLLAGAIADLLGSGAS